MTQLQQRSGDSLDRPRAWVRDKTARDPGHGVIRDTGVLRDSLPRPGALDFLEGKDDGIQIHAPILGMHASRVNAFVRKSNLHTRPMPKETRLPPSVFHENLAVLIGEASVNSWAKKHELDQTSIQRIINGQDPRLSTVFKIAAKVGIEPWTLLRPGMSQEPVRSPIATALSAYYDKATPDVQSVLARMLPIDIDISDPLLPYETDFGGLPEPKKDEPKPKKKGGEK